MVRADDAAAPPTAAPEQPLDLRRVARKIEPELAGKIERLPQYINFFAREKRQRQRCHYFKCRECAILGMIRAHLFHLFAALLSLSRKSLF